MGPQTRRSLSVAAALLVLLAAKSAFVFAQGSAGVAVRGIAYDSLHGAPLAGAFIAITGTTRTTTSDATGRFVFDSLRPGTYAVVMQHDVLDALGISGVTARAVVRDGRDTVRIAIPSFTTIWQSICRAAAPVADTGIVFGTVRGVDGRRGAAHAVVTADWIDLGVEEKTVTHKGLRLDTDADSTGNYALCGVPTTTGVRIHAALDSAVTGILELQPLDKEKVVRHDLVLGLPTVGDVTAFGVIAGQVNGEHGPVPDARVGVVGLPEIRTSADGHFFLRDVPAGTQQLKVAAIGLEPSTSIVNVVAHDTAHVAVTLGKIIALDSVRTTARYASDPKMQIFEEHRKMGLGKFVTRVDLAQQEGRKLSAIIGQFPGVTIKPGLASEAWLMSNRGPKSLQNTPCVTLQDDPSTRPDPRKPVPPCVKGCFAQIYLDGSLLSQSEVPNINRFTPDQIEAIEYYAGGSQTPPEYAKLNSQCGVLVIHTRRSP